MKNGALPRKLSSLLTGVAVALGGAASVPVHGDAAPANDKTSDLPLPVIERFESFGREQGLPAHKVHCVLPTSDGLLWIGTFQGLVVRDQGKFRTLGTEDGLSHRMVLCMVEDPKTGDLWIGTMRGLNRYSGGRFTTYTQTTSGLPNNVVYGVDIVGQTVWVATAAGLGALDLQTGSWKLFDHTNSLMHEPWCYAVKGAKALVYTGVWGGGIIEHDPAKGSFKEYRDPDRDFHFDLVADDGPINDITSWLTWEDDILWQGTYFGVSRYDGARWRTWQEKKSPLVSNFVNIIWAHRRVAWIGTDRGVSVTDGDHWVNYLVGEKGEGIMEVVRSGESLVTRSMTTALPNGFVLGIWVDDREAWFATSKGLGHGFITPPAKKTTTVAEVK
jgi:ligand-binding sensor domain-containing protein